MNAALVAKLREGAASIRAAHAVGLKLFPQNRLQGPQLPPKHLRPDYGGRFMAEHPEYAGALMRGAFEPDEAISDVVRDDAERVVELATSYIQAGQDAGQLGDFNIRRFLLRIASFAMTFHAAPSMRHYILGPQCSVREERDAFLQSVRTELAGEAGG